MTLVPNETEQALNQQYDVYAAAREEYRKKIAEQADEIERLRDELAGYSEEFPLLQNDLGKALLDNDRLRAALRWYASDDNWLNPERARAALEGK